MADQTYYTRTTIPVTKFYPGSENAADVKTFGVIATLCTSSIVPDGVVYAITKELFDTCHTDAAFMFGAGAVPAAIGSLIQVLLFALGISGKRDAKGGYAKFVAERMCFPVEISEI